MFQSADAILRENDRASEVLTAELRSAVARSSIKGNNLTRKYGGNAVSFIAAVLLIVVLVYFVPMSAEQFFIIFSKILDLSEIESWLSNGLL